MIPKDVIKNIRRIQITTSRMVTDIFAGHYHSAFKGRGMEFSEVREYQPGDDIRSIDWNVTAKMGNPYIKKFVEERELTVMVIMDISLSSVFATTGQIKSKLSAEICSLLSLSALQNNDKIGLILFTDRIEKFVPPRKGMQHVLRLIREAIYFKPEGRGTDIRTALEYLSKIASRRTVVFIISDFYAPDFKKAISIANRRHDIVAITITDPVEFDLPNIGIVQLEEAETGMEFLIDTSDPFVRKEYNKRADRLFDERKRLFNSVGVDNIDIRTDIPYAQSLVRFFRKRERRR
ncbi:MAG: DUF58 domain-containing protein [Nitrospirota bacterium]